MILDDETVKVTIEEDNVIKSIEKDSLSVSVGIPSDTILEINTKEIEFNTNVMDLKPNNVRDGIPIRYGSTIQLASKSVYNESLHPMEEVIGIFSRKYNKTAQNMLVVPPMNINYQDYFMTCEFKILPLIEDNFGKLLLYGDSFYLADIDNNTWNMKTPGFYDTISLQGKTTKGELQMAFVKQGSFSRVIYDHDTNIYLNIVGTEKFGKKYNKTITCYRKENEHKVLGGYLNFSGEGEGITFSIHKISKKTKISIKKKIMKTTKIKDLESTIMKENNDATNELAEIEEIDI